MKRAIFFLLSFIVVFSSLKAQIDIIEARGLNVGDEVTVEGIVTNGFELGIIRYIQDETGGIAVYPGQGSVADFPDNVSRGDIIRVRGPLKVFNELLEIDPVLEYTVISSGNPLPDPKEVSPSEINEDHEAQLVTLNNVKFDDGGAVFAVGNYSFSADGMSSEIYVRSNHPLVGQEIPLASVKLTGIVSQFNSIYQVLPRDNNDITVTDNFFITSAPEQSEVEIDGFTLGWETNTQGNSIVRYGTTTALGSEVVIDEMNNSHSVTLTGLEAGEFYYAQVVSSDGSNEVAGPIRFYSTASPSTGTISVYFNHEVDGSFSNGNYPASTSSAELEAAILHRIENAQTSIDISMYNTNRRPIIEALTEAYNRGVVVRMIADNETANLALQNPTPPFNIIRGNSEGLMHNKFLVIDAEETNTSWLIMGSTNFTEQNMAGDYNNMLIIQDITLCKAYTIEFEEMWGSSGEAPGVFNVKFGPDKEDNTPHVFNLNGVDIESYFSPSDNTTAEIAAEINDADFEFTFAFLIFTNNTLGTATLTAHNRGLDVRGIVDNINDTGSEYAFLSQRNVNITQDFTSKSTHHKYCIIDASNPESDPLVVTGSHNWSASAETRNDENTLIIHDAAIANIFKQEFEARWCEAMGGTACTTSTLDLDASLPYDIIVYPNPATEFFNLELNLEERSDMVVQLLDANGRVLQAHSFRNLAGEVNERFYLQGMKAGQYFINISTNEGSVTRPISVFY